MVTTASDSSPERTPAHGGVRRLLIWDAPNMDMCLAEVIRHKASGTTRPRMDAVAAWLAARCSPGERVEACVFANVGAGHEEPLARWVANLRDWGWSVFVKPKTQPRDDIDAEMIRYIERPFRQGSLIELIVASHDARAFGAPLQRYAQAGVEVTVLGYRERERVASSNANLGFIDIEDVPGAFLEPLPRTNLYDLPSGGRWFGPFATLVEAPSQQTPAGPAHASRAEAGAAAGTRPKDPAPEQSLPDPAPVDSSPRAPTATLDAPEPEPLAPPPPSPVLGEAARAIPETSTPRDLDTAQQDEPTFDLTRQIVLDVLIEETRAAHGQMLNLKEAAERLRTRFPGFTLQVSGYVDVGDLLDELHESGRIQVIRFPDGHRLVARTDADAGTGTDADTDTDTDTDTDSRTAGDPLTDPVPAAEGTIGVIDLTDSPAEPHPSAQTALVSGSGGDHPDVQTTGGAGTSSPGTSLQSAPGQPATDVAATDVTGTDVTGTDVTGTGNSGTNDSTPIATPGDQPAPVFRTGPPAAGAAGAVVVDLRPPTPPDQVPMTSTPGSVPPIGAGLQPAEPRVANPAEEDPRALARTQHRAAVGHPIYRAFGFNPEHGR